MAFRDALVPGRKSRPTVSPADATSPVGTTHRPGPRRQKVATNADNICSIAGPVGRPRHRAAVRHYGLRVLRARSSPATLFEPDAQSLAHHPDPGVDFGDLGIGRDAAHFAEALEKGAHHLDVKAPSDQRDIGEWTGAMISEGGDLAAGMRAIIVGLSWRWRARSPRRHSPGDHPVRKVGRQPRIIVLDRAVAGAKAVARR